MGANLRVLHLMSSAGFYGAENVVAVLCSQLRAVGHHANIALFDSSNLPTSDLERLTTVCGHVPVDLRFTGRFDIRALIRLARYLRSERVDILHTHGYKADIYGFIVAKLSGCAIVATCHNWTNRTDSLQSYAKYDRLILRWFNAVVAVSENVASIVDDSGVSKSNIRLIYNGIETKTYQACAPGTESGVPVIGVLSRLSEEKGVDVLVRALPSILKDYGRVHCIIAGDGPDRTSLVQLGIELGVDQHVQYPGFCANVPALLGRCTIVAHPSRIDGMPIAVLEAMAAGAPIAASAVGSIPYLLDHGHAGVLVPSEDPAALAEALIHLLKDPELRRDLGERARARAIAEFDAAIMTQKYIELYRTLLPGQRLRPTEVVTDQPAWWAQ